MKKLLLLSTVLLLGLAVYSANKNENPIDPSVTDAGVVIDGIRWATRNVGAPGTFVESPEDVGMHFQWNRRKGWATTDDITNWDSTAAEGTAWYAENDPCPPGWRVPTRTELRVLQNIFSEAIIQNGVGGRLFDIAPYQIFLPGAGGRMPNGMLGATGGSLGFYWSSTPLPAAYPHVASAWSMPFDAREFDRDNILAGSNLNMRPWGFSVRCVAKEN